MVICYGRFEKIYERHCSLLADAGTGTRGGRTRTVSVYGKCASATDAEWRAAWRRAGVDCRFSVRRGGDLAGVSGKLCYDNKSSIGIPEAGAGRQVSGGRQVPEGREECAVQPSPGIRRPGGARVQRVVTAAGDSVVGAQGGAVKRPSYRREASYRREGGWPEKTRDSGEKALQIWKKSFIINGFCNKL